MDCTEKLFVVERFDKERGCSEFHRGLFRTRIFPPCHNDDACPRRQLRQLGLHFQASYFLHPNVEDDEWDGVCFYVGEKTLRAAERADAQSVGREQATD